MDFRELGQQREQAGVRSAAAQLGTLTLQSVGGCVRSTSDAAERILLSVLPPFGPTTLETLSLTDGDLTA